MTLIPYKNYLILCDLDTLSLYGVINTMTNYVTLSSTANTQGPVAEALGHALLPYLQKGKCNLSSHRELLKANEQLWATLPIVATLYSEDKNWETVKLRVQGLKAILVQTAGLPSQAYRIEL